MANETSTGAPLTATVGERLEEKLHEAATPGVERAAAAVEDLAGAGYRPERVGAEGQPADQERREEPRRAQASGRDERARPGGSPRAAPAGRRSRVGWAVAAGLGAWIVAGMVGRAFRR